MMQTTGKIYPYAKHVNTVCNDKINNIPQDFNGKFVVEESYYETNGNRHASPHLFLITENEDGILLSSYEIPEGEDKNTFSYDSMKNVDYSELRAEGQVCLQALLQLQLSAADRRIAHSDTVSVSPTIPAHLIIP
jgi:hypothetical protein